MLDTTAPALSAVAYSRIRRMIMDGMLKPGETISEGQLAERLDVSRTPVREAVRRLGEQGLIQTTPRGLRIFRPTAEDVAEVYFLRAAIEGAIARTAAELLSPAELDQLRGFHRDSEVAAANGDIAELVELNGRFHGVLAASCRSVRATATLASLEPLVASYRRLSLLSRDHQLGSIADHARLIDLLAAADGEAAEALMRDHIARAGRRVVEAARQMEPAQGPGEPDHLRNLDILAGRKDPPG
jgi:DNA-binding GntR family transcriptional regulator